MVVVDLPLAEEKESYNVVGKFYIDNLRNVELQFYNGNAHTISFHFWAGDGGDKLYWGYEGKIGSFSGEGEQTISVAKPDFNTFTISINIDGTFYIHINGSYIGESEVNQMQTITSVKMLINNSESYDDDEAEIYVQDSFSNTTDDWRFIVLITSAVLLAVTFLAIIFRVIFIKFVKGKSSDKKDSK